MPGTPVFMRVPGFFYFCGWRCCDPIFSSVVWPSTENLQKYPSLHNPQNDSYTGRGIVKNCPRPVYFLTGILRPFKWYAAVAAYHVDLPRGADNRAALWADIFDTAVLAGLAASLYGCGFLAAVVGGRRDFQQGLAAGRTANRVLPSPPSNSWASHAAVSSVRVVTVQP